MLTVSSQPAQYSAHSIFTSDAEPAVSERGLQLAVQEVHHIAWVNKTIGSREEGSTMRIGFIGLGNVGGKLAGSLLRNGFDLTVRDLNQTLAQGFLAQGAHWADSPRAMAQQVDMLITCLPSPAACAAVMEAEDGVLAGLSTGKIWAEMSTTDDAEVKRLGEQVRAAGAEPIDCPVSGGCHRAATGNISIFAGCDRGLQGQSARDTFLAL